VWYADALVQTHAAAAWTEQASHRLSHIIGWLVRKPGAFARYVFGRNSIEHHVFAAPTTPCSARTTKRADKDYLQVLYLAAQLGESAVEAALQSC